MGMSLSAITFILKWIVLLTACYLGYAFGLSFWQFLILAVLFFIYDYLWDLHKDCKKSGML